MRYLSVSQRTVENWVSSGLIRCYRLGGRVFFDQDEIDQCVLNGGL